jgi:hypothetical protein
VEAAVVIGVLVATAFARFLRQRVRAVPWETGLRQIADRGVALRRGGALPSRWAFSVRIRASLRALICSLFSYAEACSEMTLDGIVGS